MKYLIFFLSLSVQAETYLDLGIEIHDESKNSFWQRDGLPIDSPIGIIEYGYKNENIIYYIRRQSSIRQKDEGLNTIGIKVRIF